MSSTTLFTPNAGIFRDVLHEFLDEEKTSRYYIFIYFYAFISAIHILANLILIVVLIKNYRNFKARSFFALIGSIILANFLVIVVNCVCYIPVTYSWVKPKEYGSKSVYTNVSYLELVADYMSLFLSSTISLQRFLVFYYPHRESSLFRNSGRLIVLTIIVLSIIISLAQVSGDCFFQFSHIESGGFATEKWEFLCGYSSGRAEINPITHEFPNIRMSAVAYIVYLVIKSSLPLITLICYFFIFLRMYQLRNIANQTHMSEYMQLSQSIIIFVMFQISTWFSIYVFNLEMTATDAFYAKRAVTMVDMSAATFPVIFLLATNKEILIALGLRKLTNSITNARPGAIHRRRVSAVVPTASAMNIH